MKDSEVFWITFLLCIIFPPIAPFIIVFCLFNEIFKK
jgi:hypothetical protein